MLAPSTLETANNVTSRVGRTGFAGSGLIREQTIRAAIEQNVSPFFDPSLVQITSTNYANFDQIGQPEPWNDANSDGVVDSGEYTDLNANGQYDTDMGSTGAGNAGSVVVYTVTYPWQTMTPLIGRLVGRDGVITLSARSVVKNEPFQAPPP